jgi:hypothetical protein
VRPLEALEATQLFTAGVVGVLGAQQDPEVLGGRVYGAAVVGRGDSPRHKLYPAVLLFLEEEVD